MKKLFILLLYLMTFSITQAHEKKKSRPDAHAPIGVMADHAHKKGEIMFSYRYKFVNMNQNYTRQKPIPVNDILAPKGQYAASPTSMTMQMHMLGIMYAPIDEITIMVMIPFVVNSMDHQVAAPVATMAKVNSFNAKSSGLGDSKIMLLHPIWMNGTHSLGAGLGLGLPTGSIDNSGPLPVPPPETERTLPYHMQTGSGSYEFLSGIKYLIKLPSFSIGTQVRSVIRTGKNSAGYRKGNKILLTSWFSYVLTSWLSSSVRFEWQSWGNITGADSRIAQSPPSGPPKSVTTAQPYLIAGSRLDALVGFNFYTLKGPGVDQRLAFEFGYTVYQNLAGPQLGNELTLILGWQSLVFF